jgi:putative transposase
MHLRVMLREWVARYNAGRSHKSLGPGVTDPPKVAAVIPKSESRHRIAAGAVVHATLVLGGLHHDYSLAPGVA